MSLLTAQLTHGNFGLTIKDVTGNIMQIDIPENQGGTGKGLRPMQTVLAALMGCSHADVISILQKQRQSVSGMTIEVDGNREEGKEPSLWQTVQLVFRLEGEVEPAKAFRAAELSINKYCSVAETLRRAGAAITFEMWVNGVKFENALMS
jgi:putative redox protein